MGRCSGLGLSVLLAPATGVAAEPWFEPAFPGVPAVDDYAVPAVTDLDGDGDFDVLLGGPRSGDIHWVEHRGSPSSPVFADPLRNPFDLEGVPDWATPVFADIDADGDLDAMVGVAVGRTVFFENQGTRADAVFAEGVSNPFGLTRILNWTYPAFADLDADGDFDALIGSDTGDTVYFENTGSRAVVFRAPSHGSRRAPGTVARPQRAAASTASPIQKDRKPAEAFRTITIPKGARP